MAEFRESEFNEAWLKMQRLDRQQQILNNVRIQIWNFVPQMNKYGFQVIFSALDSLFLEVVGKMDDKEIVEIETHRKSCKDFFDKLYKLQPKEWKNHADITNNISTSMFKYELLIRKKIDNHGFGGPEKLDPSKAIYQM